MKKQLLVSTLTLLTIAVTCSVAMADNSLTAGLKNVGKQVAEDSKGIAKDIKTSAQKDVENVATSTKNAKLSEIKKLKDEKLKPLDDQIAAKKKEIAMVKKSNILETEKTARLSILNRQLKYLETKRANVENTYNNKINAFKF